MPINTTAIVKRMISGWLDAERVELRIESSQRSGDEDDDGEGDDEYDVGWFAPVLLIRFVSTISVRE
jgi:hypothetical protein